MVAGNWKMNTSFAEARALALGVVLAPQAAVEVVLCPPFPWLVPVAELLLGSTVQLGAQNCWTEQAGAVTGEVAPAMLVGLCRYVIVGHSERRQLFGETDELVGAKVRAVLRNHLTPILCIGEPLDVRRAGDADDFVRGQLLRAVDGLTPTELLRCVVAYEPIWAIGTGVASTPDEAAAMAAVIRGCLHGLDPEAGEEVRVLYGGSVSAANAHELLAGKEIDGALVGGASLQAATFGAIVAAAAL
jgi:triosephosphate isomerase